jgi:hypothetical protein
MWTLSYAVTPGRPDDTIAVITGSMLLVGMVVWLPIIGSMDVKSIGEAIVSVLMVSS